MAKTRTVNAVKKTGCDFITDGASIIAARHSPLGNGIQVRLIVKRPFAVEAVKVSVAVPFEV